MYLILECIISAFFFVHETFLLYYVFTTWGKLEKSIIIRVDVIQLLKVIYIKLV